MGTQDDKSQKVSLSDTLQNVKHDAYQMKKQLDDLNIEQALEHASTMLQHLQKAYYTPKEYNELFLTVTNELRMVDVILKDSFENDTKLAGGRMYEEVQYNPSILPRMYMMITVGTSMVKSQPELTKAVLDDLVEMSRGVQHPLRGIFLRNYLLQSMRQILPDSPPTDDGEASVTDSLDVLLKNFAEMNKLWVRMQHQGLSRDSAARTAERKEIRNLVGTNLVRISQLENLTVEMYCDKVLPEILTQIINCRDPLAQSYLMESIIQVFPDEYHLDTMKPFLKAVGDLHSQVNVKGIVNALVDRLTAFATKSDVALAGKDGDLFSVFSSALGEIIGGRNGLALENVLGMQIPLIQLALTCYKDRTEFINKILHTTADMVAQYAKKNNMSTIQNNSPAAREMVALLKLPITTYAKDGSPLKILELDNFVHAFGVMANETQKLVATFLLEKIMEDEASIDLDHFEAALKIVRCLFNLAVENEKPDDDDLDLAARFCLLLDHEDRQNHFDMTVRLSEEFCRTGGESKSFLLPTIFAQFCLIGTNAYKEDAKLSERAFKNAHQIVQIVADADLALISIRLYLQGASSIQHCQFEGSVDLCYEFFTQAFVLYEEEICDSKEQVSALQILTGTLLACEGFKEEEHASLRSQCILAASRLLRKADQARAILSTSHVFWSGKVQSSDGTVRELKNGQKVYDQLKKANKTAEKCLEALLRYQLLVEILEKVHFYLADGLVNKDLKELELSLTQKIADKQKEQQASDDADKLGKHFEQLQLIINGDPPPEETAPEIEESCSKASEEAAPEVN